MLKYENWCLENKRLKIKADYLRGIAKCVFVRGFFVQNSSEC